MHPEPKFYTHHMPFFVANLLLLLCFISLSCVVLCSVILKVSIMTLSSPVPQYMFLCQVVVPSRFLCQFLLFFFSMLL